MGKDRIWWVISSRWITGLLVILIVWTLVAFISGMSFRDLEAAGQSGDSYGVLNGLFGGLTLIGVAYAASLENRQLRMARREARASSKERKRSLEIQLATAELAAMNGVAEYYRQRVTPENERLTISAFPHLDEGNPSVKYNRYHQLIRSKLAELRSPGFDWQGVTPEDQTWARRYFLVLLRDRSNRFRVIRERQSQPIGTAAGVRDLLIELRYEISLLMGQDGIVGSRDEAIFADTFWRLDPIVTALERKLNPDFEDPVSGLKGSPGYQLSADDWRGIGEFFQQFA